MHSDYSRSRNPFTKTNTPSEYAYDESRNPLTEISSSSEYANNRSRIPFTETGSSSKYIDAQKANHSNMSGIETHSSLEYVNAKRTNDPDTYRAGTPNTIKAERIEGGSSLSLCIAFATPQKSIYLAADSYSTIPCEYSNLFAGDSRYQAVDKNYQKIVHFKIADRHIAAYSTGANEFGSEKLSFKKAAESIDLSECGSVKDGIDRICRRFFELGAKGNFQISFFGHMENGFFRTEYYYTFKPTPEDKWNTEEMLYKENRPEIYFAGVEWAKQLVRCIKLKTESYDESVILSTINEFYEKIIKVSEMFDNTIGGTIRIAKLTPDSFTWLQGKPEPE